MTSDNQGAQLHLYGMIWHAGAPECIAAIAVMACVIVMVVLWRRRRASNTRKRPETPKDKA